MLFLLPHITFDFCISGQMAPSLSSPVFWNLFHENHRAADGDFLVRLLSYSRDVPDVVWRTAHGENPQHPWQWHSSFLLMTLQVVHSVSSRWALKLKLWVQRGSPALDPVDAFFQIRKSICEGNIVAENKPVWGNDTWMIAEENLWFSGVT